MNLAFEERPEISKVLLFGSRAMGNAKPGSDVDLAIFGKGVNSTTILKLSQILNQEQPLPWTFDILDAEHLEHQPLLQHIHSKGKYLYQKNIRQQQYTRPLNNSAKS
jgi:predicted nucleotidyltransferase